MTVSLRVRLSRRRAPRGLKRKRNEIHKSRRQQQPPQLQRLVRVVHVGPEWHKCK
jgi:hypothetical protein